jgi:membrane fusion protein (multidrug efflux system)
MKHTHLGIILATTAIILYSCNSRGISEDQSQSNLEIPVYEITSKTLNISEDFVAEINAQQNVEIRSRVKGFLDKIHVDEGKFVRKGQPLFNISDDIYQSELKKAKANTQITIAEAKAAQLTMENTKTLVDKGVVNRTEYELAKAKYESLQAKVDEAKAMEQLAEINLSHALIKAPFDGFVDRIPFKVGSVIDEGTLLTTVSDVNNMHVYFKISEIEYLNFTKQKNFLDSFKPQLVLANGMVHEFAGKLETIEGDFETGTGTIAIRANFPNTNKILKHGSSGRVRLFQNRDSVILIPQKSTFEIQDKVFVYVLNKENKLELKSLNILQRYEDYYIVSNKSLIGKMIVFEGLQKLKEGMIVKPKKVSETEVKNGLS